MPPRFGSNDIQLWLVAPANRWRDFVTTHPRSLRALRIGAIALFVVSIVVAVLRQPRLIQGVDWWLLLFVVAIGAPATICLNAERFRLSSAIVSIPRSFTASLKISVASTAANLLPMPGGVVVRVAALKSEDSTYSGVFGITLGTALLGVGAALLFGGVALVLRTEDLGWLLLAVAVCGSAVSIGVIYFAGAVLAQCALLCLVELAMVAVGASRLWLCLLALGVDADWSAGAFLSMASIAGSVAGIAPGGFGVREIAAAALAPAVALSPEEGLLGSAVNQLLGTAVLCGVLAIQGWGERGGSVPEDPRVN